MKKVNSATEEKQDDLIIKKLLDLSLLYENENSKNWIRLVSYQIKGYEIQKEHLIDNKPYFFQKKKLEEHNKKIEELDNKILKCLKDIEDEIKYMEDNLKVITDTKRNTVNN
ncbi:MAG: hypothetical protein ACI310_05950 [Bacilli bacterium]